MSRFLRSQTVRLSFKSFPSSYFQGNKKPCLRFVSRVEKVYFGFLPAYRQSIQVAFGLFFNRGRG
jgi:hypothetical protein